MRLKSRISCLASPSITLTAMCRGVGPTIERGFSIDGRCFSGVLQDNRVFTGGINAGVMILAPARDLHFRTLQKVSTIVHRERIPGKAPEQDYLSRSEPWSWQLSSTRPSSGSLLGNRNRDTQQRLHDMTITDASLSNLSQN